MTVEAPLFYPRLFFNSTKLCFDPLEQILKVKAPTVIFLTYTRQFHIVDLNLLFMLHKIIFEALKFLSVPNWLTHLFITHAYGTRLSIWRRRRRPRPRWRRFPPTLPQPRRAMTRVSLRITDLLEKTTDFATFLLFNSQLPPHTTFL